MLAFVIVKENSTNSNTSVPNFVTEQVWKQPKYPTVKG